MTYSGSTRRSLVGWLLAFPVMVALTDLAEAKPAGKSKRRRQRRRKRLDRRVERRWRRTGRETYHWCLEGAELVQPSCYDAEVACCEHLKMPTNAGIDAWCDCIAQTGCSWCVR